MWSTFINRYMKKKYFSIRIFINPYNSRIKCFSSKLFLLKWIITFYKSIASYPFSKYFSFNFGTNLSTVTIFWILNILNNNLPFVYLFGSIKWITYFSYNPSKAPLSLFILSNIYKYFYIFIYNIFIYFIHHFTY